MGSVKASKQYVIAENTNLCNTSTSSSHKSTDARISYRNRQRNSSHWTGNTSRLPATASTNSSHTGSNTNTSGKNKMRKLFSLQRSQEETNHEHIASYEKGHNVVTGSIQNRNHRNVISNSEFSTLGEKNQMYKSDHTSDSAGTGHMRKPRYKCYTRYKYRSSYFSRKYQLEDWRKEQSEYWREDQSEDWRANNPYVQRNFGGLLVHTKN